MSRTTARPSRPSLATNLAAAGAAGAVTLLRPSRFPRWARRSLLASNTAGTGAALLLGPSSEPGGPALPARLGAGGARAAAAASTLAAVTSGLSLVTSRVGIKADARAERFLLDRGVNRPRVWMAVGVVGVVLVAQAVQERAARAAEQAAARLQQEHDAPQSSPRLPTGGATRLGDG